MLVKRRRAPVYNIGNSGLVVLYACSAWIYQDVLGVFFSRGWVSGLGVFYEHTRRHSTGYAECRMEDEMAKSPSIK
jgi:hypothetical protein